MAAHAHSTPVLRRRLLHLGFRKTYPLPSSSGPLPRRVFSADVIAFPAIASAQTAEEAFTAAIYAVGRRLPVDLSDRLELLRHRQRILNLAGALLELADAIDAPFADLEPEPHEEGDADEASAQQLPPLLPVASRRRARRVV